MENLTVVRLYERPSPRHNWRLIVEHPESYGLPAILAWGQRFVLTHCPERLLGYTVESRPSAAVLTRDVLSRRPNDPDVRTVETEPAA